MFALLISLVLDQSPAQAEVIQPVPYVLDEMEYSRVRLSVAETCQDLRYQAKFAPKDLKEDLDFKQLESLRMNQS